jgi:hypothetical protein
MTEEEYNQALAKGDVNFLSPLQSAAALLAEPDNQLAGYIAVLQYLRSPKGYLKVAPTFRPKIFLDQIQFYDDGTNRRIYFYVNKVWRYTTLT